MYTGSVSVSVCVCVRKREREHKVRLKVDGVSHQLREMSLGKKFLLQES